MATLANIRTQTRNIMSEINVDSTGHFPNANSLDDYINEAVRYLGTLIEYPRKVVTIAAVSNTPNYTINAITNKIISILSCYFGNRTVQGDIREIAVIKEPMLSGVNPSWYETVASNNGRPRRIILFDRDTIWCDPKPDSTYSQSGYNFYLYVSTVPVDLSLTTDTPDLPFAYHDVVAYHAASIAFLSIKEQTNSEKALAYFDKKRQELEPHVVKESEKFLQFDFVDSDPTEFGNPGESRLIAEGTGGRLII